MLRESRDQYLASVEADYKSNPKRFWTLLRLKSKSRSVPHCISMATVSDNSSSTARRTFANTPKAISNLFNQYFAFVFIDSTNSNSFIDYESTDNCTYDAERIVLNNIRLTDHEVEHVLKSLVTSKATGPDEIPARLHRETAEVITPSLCYLFNKSLGTGFLPNEWKLANIVPVYKKGEREYAENYRPISLLPITLER